MPGPHRLFLEHVSKIANIRDYVNSHPQDVALNAAFNKCLEGLVAFRNKHLQMVSRYIVVPSRVSRSRGNDTQDALKTAAKGTGGTAPVAFLKQVRDETRDGLLRQ